MGGFVALAVSAVETAGSYIATGASDVAGALGASQGVATAFGTAAEDAVGGALEGAGKAALTGGNILQGAEFGGITGGFVGGLGGELGSLTGLGTTAGDTIAGALGGEFGGLATGQKGVAPALEGAAGGFVAGGGLSGGQGATQAPGGGGASAAASAAPAGIGGGAPDLSLSTDGASAVAGTSTGIPGTFTTNTGALPGDVGAGAAAGGNLSVTGLGSGGAAAQLGNIEGLTPAQMSTNPITQLGGAEGLTTSAPAGGSATPAAGGGTGTGIMGALTKNPIQTLALGADLLGGNKKPAFEGQLEANAGKLAAQGSANENYLNTGTLPPAMQGALNAAQNDAAASIRAQYAARGQSGSSAEAQDVASLSQRIAAQGQQIALQLFNSGVSETEASDQIYTQLMGVQMQQDASLSSSISKLASSFALMGTPLAASGG